MKIPSINLEIDSKEILKKPYQRYMNTGGIGEKIFEEYCRKNKINFTKPVFLMWAVYFDYLIKKHGELTKRNQNKFKKWNCGKLLILLSEREIQFLTEEFIVKSKLNFEIVGFPDYVIWKKRKLTLVEIKTGYSTLSDIQIKVFSNLKNYFDVRLCHIEFKIKVKKLDLSDIKIRGLNESFDKSPYIKYKVKHMKK